MAIIGSVNLDERAIVRDGAKVTATIMQVPASKFYFSKTFAAITPNIDQILIHYYNGDHYIRSAVETVIAVHEYQIDPTKDIIITLKFSYMDQDRISNDRDIPLIISSLVRHNTALAVEFTGALDDMNTSDIAKYILENYASFTHLGIKYHYVNISHKLRANTTYENPETQRPEYYYTTTGVVAMYTSVDPIVKVDQEIAKALAVTRG